MEIFKDSWMKGKVATFGEILDDGTRRVLYHHTPVVAWKKTPEGTRVTLQSNGHQTMTTKSRMNDVGEQYHLNFAVYQRKGKWHVSLPSGVVDFEDGMEFIVARDRLEAL